MQTITVLVRAVRAPHLSQAGRSPPIYAPPPSSLRPRCAGSGRAVV